MRKYLLHELTIIGCACWVSGCSDATPFPAEGLQHTRIPAPSADVARQLAELRQATAPFHDFDRAVEAGYAAQITPCWEHRSRGAMGYHYGNPDFLFDGGAVNLLEPETLMYEPGPGGQLKLVGLEYIVFIDDWAGVDPPMLLGQAFHPHSFLPIFKLHIWLWRDNPAGMFADWNPKVSCRHAAETEFFD
jgi:hypothetical protein